MKKNEILPTKKFAMPLVYAILVYVHQMEIYHFIEMDRIRGGDTRAQCTRYKIQIKIDEP